MSELIENLELEAHYLYKSTPGFNRKQRGFVYHVDIYETFVRLTEKGIKKPIIIVASMLKYIEKIEKHGFREPIGDDELKPYVLYKEHNYGKRIPAYIPIELLERFEKLDVPMNKRLTYMIAMYEYLVSKGEL